MSWLPFDTVPMDGSVFLALNHDREVWPAKFISHGGGPRVAFRTNKLWEPRSYIVHTIDGKRLLEEQPGQEGERWWSSWTYWTRGYEFKPTHWMPLPAPPEPQP